MSGVVAGGGTWMRKDGPYVWSINMEILTSLNHMSTYEYRPYLGTLRRGKLSPTI